ncbi:MAG: hypothetical protein LAT67_15200 [Balneolales bacterium]|nr:hypothetical protein [Balneolales bacterium]
MPTGTTDGVSPEFIPGMVTTQPSPHLYAGGRTASRQVFCILREMRFCPTTNVISTPHQ